MVADRPRLVRRLLLESAAEAIPTMKKTLKLKKLNPAALKETVAAEMVPTTTPTAAPKPYYSSY